MAEGKGRKKSGTGAGGATAARSSLAPMPPPGPHSPAPELAASMAVTLHGSIVPPAAVAAGGGKDPLDEFFLDNARDGGLLDVEVSNREAPEMRDEHQRVLVFGLGDEEYGLEIMEVREILKPPVLTEVPRAPMNVLGVFSLRGLVLPVLNLADILGAHRSGEARSAEARVLVVGRGDETVGLYVHRVAQVVKMSTRTAEPAPGGIAVSRRALLRGLSRVDDRLVILLDLPQLMSHLGLTPAAAELVAP